MAKGKLVGKGNTAEVFLWGEHDVIKLFHQQIPEELIEREYRSNLLIQNLQLPSPEVKGMTVEAGLKGIIYEKVDGTSLTKLLAKNPFSIKKNAKLFAQLHDSIHQIEGNGLPRQKEVLKRHIQATELLTSGQKQNIVEFLLSLPDGSQVCHGDFHPDNILVSNDQVKVIDWMTASVGNPLGDIARTLTILQYAYLPESMLLVVRLLIQFVRKGFSKHYLQEYGKHQELNMEELEKWTLPIMAARLIERIHPDEKEELIKAMRPLYKKFIMNSPGYAK